ncbi:MAG: AraC family transcriptional regulator [SAR324 cluster bacterium]|nr:AraC family transcriptional regulator [SAR324 cluster bacterium]
MQKIISLVDQLAIKEGYNQTSLPQVGIYKDSHPKGRAPLVYQQGVIFLLQGKKKVYTEDSKLEYDRNNYLVLTVPLPLECEALVKPNEPLLGLMLDIDIPTLNSIINLMGNSVDFDRFKSSEKDCGLFVAPLVQEIKDALYRLVKVLQNPVETNILGSGILRELVFHILKDEKSAPLYALSMRNTNLSKIEMALQEIHKKYDQSIDVNGLAKIVNMSVSSFHHTFKEVTSSSPIQYIKKIRLVKARALIAESGLRVNEAARKVGYESVSQFSREFKRYYGAPPKNFILG